MNLYQIHHMVWFKFLRMSLVKYDGVHKTQNFLSNNKYIHLTLNNKLFIIEKTQIHNNGNIVCVNKQESIPLASWIYSNRSKLINQLLLKLLKLSFPDIKFDLNWLKNKLCFKLFHHAAIYRSLFRKMLFSVIF